VKDQKTCIAVILYAGFIMTKAKEPNMNNGHDTSQNKAVNIRGQILTSINIVV
jgi:hypothetical protein